MSESWTWSFAGAGGDGSSPRTGPERSVPFPTQADAESWFAESWQDLADAGVAQVTLRRDGAVVYGPMPLEPA